MPERKPPTSLQDPCLREARDKERGLRFLREQTWPGRFWLERSRWTTFSTLSAEEPASSLAWKIAFTGAESHRRERAHASVRLERPALIQNGFSRALVDARKERDPIMTELAPGCDRLGDFTGIFDTAVRNDRDTTLFGSAIGLGDGGNLGHAGTAVTMRVVATSTPGQSRP